MLRKTNAIRTTLSFALLMGLVATSIAGRVAVPGPTANPGPSKTDCSTVTDLQIEQAITKALEKAFPNADERKEFLLINATSENKGEVKIEGGVAGDKMCKKVIKTIEKVECVKRVDSSKLKCTRGGGCGDTQQECNGTCIAASAHCNLMRR